jgi:hypothetical protein
MIDPVYKHAKREALVIIATWLGATAYTCGYCYLYGYLRPDHRLGAEDIQPVLGMPSWFVWGVMAPWAFCAVFTFVFAGWFIKDDDLGSDHSAELDRDIREAGHDE